MIKSLSSHMMCHRLGLTQLAVSCMVLLLVATPSHGALTNDNGEIVRLNTDMAVDNDFHRPDCDKFVSVNGLSSKAAHHIVRAFNECSGHVAAIHGMAHNPLYFLDPFHGPTRKLGETENKKENGLSPLSNAVDVTTTTSIDRPSLLRAHSHQSITTEQEDTSTDHPEDFTTNDDEKQATIEAVLAANTGSRGLQLEFCNCVTCEICCDLFEMLCAGCGTVPCNIGTRRTLTSDAVANNTTVVSGLNVSAVPSQVQLEEDMHLICDPYMRKLIDQFLAHTPAPNDCLGTSSSNATFYFNAKASLDGVWF